MMFDRSGDDIHLDHWFSYTIKSRIFTNLCTIVPCADASFHPWCWYIIKIRPSQTYVLSTPRRRSSWWLIWMYYKIWVPYKLMFYRLCGVLCDPWFWYTIWIFKYLCSVTPERTLISILNFDVIKSR